MNGNDPVENITFLWKYCIAVLHFGSPPMKHKLNWFIPSLLLFSFKVPMYCPWTKSNLDVCFVSPKLSKLSSASVCYIPVGCCRQIGFKCLLFIFLVVLVLIKGTPWEESSNTPFIRMETGKKEEKKRPSSFLFGFISNLHGDNNELCHFVSGIQCMWCHEES